MLSPWLGHVAFALFPSCSRQSKGTLSCVVLSLLYLTTVLENTFYSLVGREFDSNLLSLPRQQLFSGAAKPIRATVGIVQTGDNLQLWSGDFLKDELGNSLAA